MPSRWDAATHGWSRRVFHYPLPTLMSRNFRLPYTIELQPLSLTPLKMRKVEFGSERLTGALLDRLTHHVHILEMNGESYRLKGSRQSVAAPSSAPDRADAV